ncbi:hypothetical protein [Leptodesmis sichuanensis]|nr:hypothetical protein [Leptodesmis sichuanensis]UIE36382.1 hypothetical protein KIK02_15115 [Leptodesmis sichuanensis A121]
MLSQYSTLNPYWQYTVYHQVYQPVWLLVNWRVPLRHSQPSAFYHKLYN